MYSWSMHSMGFLLRGENMQDLISKDDKGNLIVTSLVVAEVTGRAHKNVLQSLDKIINKNSRLGFKLIDYIDKNGSKQRAYELTEEQFLIAMPFIGGEKSIEGQTLLVGEFIRLRNQEQNKNRHIDAIRSLLLLDSPSTWEKLYPDSFFIAVMNLHGHKFEGNRSTPIYCANVIRRWIYDIVLPDELNIEIDTKRGTEKKHQWFEKDNGRTTLLQQIAKVEMIAAMSQNRVEFESNCAMAFLGSPLQLNVFK